MWLAVRLPAEIHERAEREFFYETLLSVSPDVYCGPSTSLTTKRKEPYYSQNEIALVFLGAVTKYWKLSSLMSPPTKRNNDKQQKSGAGSLPSFNKMLEGSAPKISDPTIWDHKTPDSQTPIPESLQKFFQKLTQTRSGLGHKKLGQYKLDHQKTNSPTPSPMIFTLSPLPYYSQALLHLDLEDFCCTQKVILSQHQTLYSYTKETLAEVLKPLPIHLLSILIPDLLNKNESSKSQNISQMEYFFECAEELGLYKLEDLTKIISSPQDYALFLERFGPDVCCALQRLQGFGKPLTLKRYKSPENLFYSFSPMLEKESSSETHSNLLDRFLEIFLRWEDLLSMQKMSLTGLQISLKSYLKAQPQVFVFNFARPMRKAKHLMKIVQEKLFSTSSLNPNTEVIVYDNIEHVSLLSLGTTDQADRQLDLFNPHKESVLEDWSLLITEALNVHKDIRIGYYQAFESYLPEHSVEWRPWDSAQDLLPTIEDHPPRPEWILEQPIPYTKTQLLSEEDFLNFVKKQGALSTLERIRDPWRNIERTYAKIAHKWIFWEHVKKKCFLHGIFESPTNMAITETILSETFL